LYDLSGVGPGRFCLEAIFLIGELGFFELQPFMIERVLALLQPEASPGAAKLAPAA
jgi:hypothetical protein